MIAVIFDPSDGKITQTIQGSKEAIAQNADHYLEVSEFKSNYDTTYKVVNGTLVPLN